MASRSSLTSRAPHTSLTPTYWVSASHGRQFQIELEAKDCNSALSVGISASVMCYNSSVMVALRLLNLPTYLCFALLFAVRKLQFILQHFPAYLNKLCVHIIVYDAVSKRFCAYQH